jgi:hypothetical protein
MTNRRGSKKERIDLTVDNAVADKLRDVMQDYKFCTFSALTNATIIEGLKSMGYKIKFKKNRS